MLHYLLKPVKERIVFAYTGYFSCKKQQQTFIFPEYTMHFDILMTLFINCEKIGHHNKVWVVNMNWCIISGQWWQSDCVANQNVREHTVSDLATAGWCSGGDEWAG